MVYKGGKSMNQQTYDGIMNVLQRGSGVMAQEYCQAFSAVVAELQKRIQKDNEVAEVAEVAEAQPKATKSKTEKG